MDKIPINEVSKEVYTQKGFDSGPFNLCLTCKCGDDLKGSACCKDGVYVDKVSHDLIVQHKEIFENELGVKIEECFESDWTKDNEYLGKTLIATNLRHDSCIFLKDKKCTIISAVLDKKLPRTMIPTACRVYPITWDKGKLFVGKIQKNCVCVDEKYKIDKSIFETQKKEIDDCFEITVL